MNSADAAHRLNEIGIALAQERDTRALLELIVSGARELLECDAGSLYGWDAGQYEAYFKTATAICYVLSPDHYGQDKRYARDISFFTALKPFRERVILIYPQSEKKNLVSAMMDANYTRYPKLAEV